MSFLSPSSIFRAGAGLTAVGISFGAFGSHSLRSRLSALPSADQARSLSSWSTGSSYMIYNGLALLAVGIYTANPSLLLRRAPAVARWAAPLIISGTVMFSGSIFALVLAREKVGKVLGPVTPLGGLLMIAGYITLVL